LFVDFSLPTKPPSTYNVPTNKEFNLVGVIVQAFDHEGFALPNQNVITSYMQTRFNSRGKNVVKMSVNGCKCSYANEIKSPCGHNKRSEV